MLRDLAFLAAAVGLASASQNVFSIHDDILGFPQYEVVFADPYILDTAAASLLRAPQPSAHPESTSLQPQDPSNLRNDQAEHSPPPTQFSYERLILDSQPYLCAIPTVTTPPRNETSEAAARAAEAKELARATTRGWELLRDLEGDCLYFVLGWWSYSFCYNNGVTQFHQLPPQAGRPVFPPQRDMNTPLYVLGRAKPKGQKTQREEGEGEGEGGGNELEVRKAGGAPGGLGSEMQVKGDTRYLMQTLEHGTVCDLTGRPRRIEIQYHCAPSTTDKIGWIKEVTTCSYLMVVYTPRLCNDVAFLPPKETKAHEITCSAIISEDEILEYEEKKRDEKAMKAFNAATKLVDTIDIGGMALGGGKYFGRDTGLHLPMPKNLGINNGVDVEVVPVVIARSKGEGHPVESLTDEQLVMMDLKPEAVEQLREELAEMAGKKPWRLEVVQPPGEIKEIRAIVEEDEEMKEHANEWENGRKEKEKEKLEKENIEQSGKQKVPKIAKEEEKVKMKQNAKEGQMQKSQEREKEKEKEKEKETDSEEGSEETYHEDL